MGAGNVYGPVTYTPALQLVVTGRKASYVDWIVRLKGRGEMTPSLDSIPAQLGHQSDALSLYLDTLEGDALLHKLRGETSPIKPTKQCPSIVI